MNKYAVSIFDSLDNKANEIFVIESENKIEAMLKTMLLYYGENGEDTKDENVIQWVDDLRENEATVDVIINELFNGDVAISKPVLIK